MKYKIREHGDLLEKIAAPFIEEKLPFYESIWMIYIGNKGDNLKAELPNYKDEKTRNEFAENSYSLLESSFIAYKILESRIFLTPIESFDNYFEYNKSFYAFFANLGRIYDLSIKISDSFQEGNKCFQEKIKHIYQSRNIVLHGKKVPIVFDEYKLGEIPVFNTIETNYVGWHDKANSWEDAKNMNIMPTEDSTRKLLDDLLSSINDEYARIYDVICKELKDIPTSILFEYKSNNYEITAVSNMSGSSSHL